MVFTQKIKSGQKDGEEIFCNAVFCADVDGVTKKAQEGRVRFEEEKFSFSFSRKTCIKSIDKPITMV